MNLSLQDLCTIYYALWTRFNERGGWDNVELASRTVEAILAYPDLTERAYWESAKAITNERLANHRGGMWPA